MIATAIKKAEVFDEEMIYKGLYSDIEVDFEILQDEGIYISNPNPFHALRDWTDYSSSLGSNPEKRRYVSNLFRELSLLIEAELVSWKVLEVSVKGLAMNEIKKLIESIEDLKSIMLEIATSNSDIVDEEPSYIETYDVSFRLFCRFQEVGIPLRNPNRFVSLWQWYQFYSDENFSSSERRAFVSALYADVVKPIQSALRKHERQLTSLDSLIQDLIRRFGKQSQLKMPEHEEIKLPLKPMNPIVDSETPYNVNGISGDNSLSLFSTSLNSLTNTKNQDRLSSTSHNQVCNYQSRNDLYLFLAHLPVQEFDRLLFAFRAPSEYIPGKVAPQGDRVSALLAWAESLVGCGLEQLESVLKAEYPNNFN